MSSSGAAQGSVARFVYRLPIALYRLRLGWLLGGRFLLLTHVGRRTGLRHDTVVEVMRHDVDSDTFYVASGFGRSNWLRNVERTPLVSLQIKTRRLQAKAMVLSPAEAERELLAYAKDHPAALRFVGRVLGLSTDGSPESIHALAQCLPVVAFKRVDEGQKG